MLFQVLALCTFVFAAENIGDNVSDGRGYSEEVDSDEVQPNIAEFELTFGEDCSVPSLPELEKTLRQLFDLGVVLYDADLDEEIDVIINYQQVYKCQEVVSFLQTQEGLNCEISMSELTFAVSEVTPDSNAFIAEMYQEGFVEDANHPETEDERRMLASYPEELDLRKFNPQGVRNQRRTSTCAAHATATVKEIHENMDYGLTERLSTRFLYAQRLTTKIFGKENTFDGMNHWHVFLLLKYNGIPLEKDYPWSSGDDRTSGKYDTFASIPADVKRKAKMHRVSKMIQFVPWFKSVGKVKNRLKQLLNKYSAGVIWIWTFGHGEAKNSGKSCAIYKRESGDKFRGLHMMAVVGYNKDGIIVRNSWGAGWCVDPVTKKGGDIYISWYDAARYIPEYNFWKDMDSQSCDNFELFTGKSCWSLGGRALNPSGKCSGKECSLVDANRCCKNKPKTCLNRNSCCLWGTTCYGCPDNGNSKFEWAWNCGGSRRCNGRGGSNECRKSPGDCCFWGSDCHGCPWGSEWVGPTTCGTSRRCKNY